MVAAIGVGVFGASWWLAFMAGQNWKLETTARNGMFIVVWIEAIMAGFGFTWCEVASLGALLGATNQLDPTLAAAVGRWQQGGSDVLAFLVLFVTLSLVHGVGWQYFRVDPTGVFSVRGIWRSFVTTVRAYERRFLGVGEPRVKAFIAVTLAVVAPGAFLTEMLARNYAAVAVGESRTTRSGSPRVR